MSDFSMNTPWGHAQTHENIGRGVIHVTTAGHGGFFVPECMLHNISEGGRIDAAYWSGSEQWYEEDDCWAHVAVAFPDLFTDKQVQSAKRHNAERNL